MIADSGCLYTPWKIFRTVCNNLDQITKFRSNWDSQIQDWTNGSIMWPNWTNHNAQCHTTDTTTVNTTITTSSLSRPISIIRHIKMAAITMATVKLKGKTHISQKMTNLSHRLIILLMQGFQSQNCHFCQQPLLSVSSHWYATGIVAMVALFLMMLKQWLVTRTYFQRHLYPTCSGMTFGECQSLEKRVTNLIDHWPY